jgi:predicted acetyltransferase
VRIVRPAYEHLPSYIAALQRGWSPDNLRPEAAQELLARIAENPELFLEQMDDRDARGPDVILPSGATVKRLPGYVRWMWDGEFCGSIGFRWQPGTTALPPHCHGHIGYAVVPWKRSRGYATAALAQLLDEVRGEGLEFVELTTESTNEASRHVIEANRGEIASRRVDPGVHGGGETLTYRIRLRS